MDANEEEEEICDASDVSEEDQALEYVPSAASTEDVQEGSISVFIDETNYNHLTLSRDTLLSMTSKCFMYHRLKNSFKMFDIILEDKRMPDEAIFKMGSLLFHTNIENDNDLDLLREFAGYCFSLKHYRAEIFLEFLMFYLCKKDILAARRLIDSHFKAVEKVRIHKCNVIRTLTHCYSAFVSYLQWESTVSAFDSESENIIFDNGVEIRVNDVLETFRKVTLIENGSFDLFVVCLIKILMYYRRFLEAKEQLYAYKENNPNHPHSYIYLYKFLFQRCDEDEDSKSECRRKLSELSPDDPLLLKMVEEDELSDTVESIQILMNFVDFKKNKCNENAWKQISLLLKKLDLNSDNDKKLRSIYESMHKKHWSLYHFNDRLFQRDDPKDLLYFKSIVIAFFEGASHPFVKLVLNAFTYDENLKISLKNEINRYTHESFDVYSIT